MMRRQGRLHKSSLNGKWCLLLVLSVGVFVYMVLVTEVLHLTPSPSSTDSAAAFLAKSGHHPLLDILKNSFFSSSQLSSAAILEDNHVHPDLFVLDTFVSAINTSEKEHGASSGDQDDTSFAELDVEERHIPRRKQGNKKKRNQKKRGPINETEIDWSKYTFEESAMPPNMSNMEFYNISSDGEFNLWDNDPTLPYWMKSYFNWHKWKRKTWDLDNWKSERWMVIQCLMDQDKRKCGGTSDRLKPIPTLLRMAYDTKRILLIRWTRPSMLEDFLMPPEGGLDWRVPPAMVDVIQNVSYGKKLTPFSMIDKYAHSGMSLVRTKYQTNTPDLTYSLLVDQDRNASLSDYALRMQVELPQQPDFNQVFHTVWRIFFTPSAPVTNVIQSKLTSLGLTPNHYVASHLRALYAVDNNDRPEWHIQLYAENALACATQLRPGVPIFFASDSSVATAHALKVGQEKRVSCTKTIFDKQPVVEALSMGVVASIPNPNPPWHLDTMIGPVEKFYDTFVDLYLMALAGCVTYGKGGYGHWASLIGGNINCTLKQDFMSQRRRQLQNPCNFTVGENGVVASEPVSTAVDSLLLPPMKTSIDGDKMIS
jgi:hypothetical protein